MYMYPYMHTRTPRTSNVQNTSAKATRLMYITCRRTMEHKQQAINCSSWVICLYHWQRRSVWCHRVRTFSWGMCPQRAGPISSVLSHTKINATNLPEILPQTYIASDIFSRVTLKLRFIWRQVTVGSMKNVVCMYWHASPDAYTYMQAWRERYEHQVNGCRRTGLQFAQLATGNAAPTDAARDAIL